MTGNVKYIHQMGELFERVQLERVFPDNKTFPDCVPVMSLGEIIERYNAAKGKKGFDLTTFVYHHFDLPGGHDLSYQTVADHTPQQHIENLWEVLTREPQPENSTIIPLKFSYVVPGGRFREVYYWDSYFTMLGLEVSGRYDLIENIVKNFAGLLNELGHIPNANRAYYVGRSQPPFFALMLDILSRERGRQIYTQYLPQLEKEYSFWMNTERCVLLPGGEYLNRYWDELDTPRPESYREDVELFRTSRQPPGSLFRNLRAAAESGWDFSSRWLRETGGLETIRTTELIPVDLNCLLYFLEETLAEAWGNNGNTEAEEKYRSVAEKRKVAIEKYLWKPDKGFYFDYDIINRSSAPSYHLAAAYPLFFGLANKIQAFQVAEILETEFLKKGGLVTTLQTSGQQWDAPNGWAPLQWMAYAGLKRYGYADLAAEIRERWINTNLKVYENEGKMTEKYDVVNENTRARGGEYPNQDGFGWTNGVLLRMLAEGTG